MYQLFVGEIGIARNDFLYRIEFWEARRIIRGYRRRNILQYQLQRLTAYSSFYSMRENKSGKTPSEWMPLYFDHDESQDESPITEEECKELIAEMEAFERQLEAERKSSEE